jgi:hypothetical protein
MTTRSIANRLARLEEQLASQLPPEAEDDEGLVHISDLNLPVEVYDEILTAIERLESPDPDGTVEIDELDLPLAARQQILTALESAVGQRDDPVQELLPAEPLPQYDLKVQTRQVVPESLNIPVSPLPPQPPPPPLPVVLDLPSSPRRDPDRLDGVRPERRWYSR